MIRSLYTAGTGMLVQRDRMEVVSNNLTNTETAGFKSDTLISGNFRDLMLARLHDEDVLNTRKTVGPLGPGVHIDRVHTVFEPGSLEETGRALDLAISGEGFFAITTPDGERYTRDGNFALDAAGYLVTSEGWYVQGENGRIHMGGEDFNVDSTGAITSADGQPIARLRIVTFDDLNGLRKEGNNLYSNTAAGQPRRSARATVTQRYLEGSNVDVTTEITRLMTVSKAYQTNQRVFGIIDSSLEKTVNEVGRV